MTVRLSRTRFLFCQRASPRVATAVAAAERPRPARRAAAAGPRAAP